MTLLRHNSFGSQFLFYTSEISRIGVAEVGRAPLSISFMVNAIPNNLVI